MKKKLYFIIACTIMYCVPGIAQIDSSITAPVDGMSPKYPPINVLEDKDVILQNYSKVPLVMCVSSNIKANCKCLTVNAGKQVSLTLKPEEKNRTVKVFNSNTSTTKFRVYPGNTYPFTYDAGKKEWVPQDL